MGKKEQIGKLFNFLKIKGHLENPWGMNKNLSVALFRGIASGRCSRRSQGNLGLLHEAMGEGGRKEDGKLKQETRGGQSART